MIDNCEIKAWKNSGLNGIQTYDLFDSGAVVYQLSYQAIWELVTLSSLYTCRRWRIQMNISKIIYLNYRERWEFKAWKKKSPDEFNFFFNFTTA